MSQSPPDLPRRPYDSAGSFDQDRRRPGPLAPWSLVLINNDNADLMVVVHTIMEITHYGRAEATHRMWQAHHTGRAILLHTHRERAELYVEQFAAKGLTVAVEPTPARGLG